MRLAFIRSEAESAVFSAGPGLSDDALLHRLRISAKAGSSSKNIILELLQRGLLLEAEEWKFWDRPGRRIDAPGLLPVRVFEGGDGHSAELAGYVAKRGAPDILWVEGPAHPPHLRQAIDLCRSAFKLVYSKDWKPWKVERLQDYDLCLVDEPWQAERLAKKFPGLASGVWDKLIDYETSHFPIAAAKQYDLIYVAYFRARKNHALLLDALARVRGRNLKTLFIGGDRKSTRAGLEARARELGLDVEFRGEVSKSEVNSYVNQSRIGCMLAEKDAAPRVILEYLAADVPVLVNADLRAGARYVDERSGLVLPPERLHDGIVRILDDYDSFTPRSAYLERFSRDRVIETFLDLLRAAGCDLRQPVA